MPESLDLPALDDAMRGFVRRELTRRPPRSTGADIEDMPRILAFRAETRLENGGGGMCHLVTEALAHERGWGRLAVTYLSADGEIVTDGHYVNLLADGTIVDPTADQFGEGHDVRILRPDDPGYGRYRPEFDIDYNPGTAPELAAWEPAWAGETDWDAHVRLSQERGHGWWVQDPQDLLTYLGQRRAYAEADAFSHGDVRLVDRWVGEIESRFGAGAPSP